MKCYTVEYKTTNKIKREFNDLSKLKNLHKFRVLTDVMLKFMTTHEKAEK